MQDTFTKPSESYRDLWGLILLAGLAVFLAGVAVWMLSSQIALAPLVRPDQGQLDGISQTEFTAETGVRVLRITFTAGGGMLDLRYQVVDPDKAVIMHDVDTPPILVNEDTGQILDRPYHEHSSDTLMRAGLTYNELIVNERRIIKPGNRMTLIAGESRLEHIPVQ